MSAAISSIPPFQPGDIDLLIDRANELVAAGCILERERDFAIAACAVLCKERDAAHARIAELEAQISVWKARYERIAP